MSDWLIELAPGVPDSTTEAIQRIGRSLAATEQIHRDAYCLTCGSNGLHAHWEADRG